MAYSAGTFPFGDTLLQALTQQQSAPQMPRPIQQIPQQPPPQAPQAPQGNLMDVLRQHMANQQQDNAPTFTAQALQQRFQPTMTDTSNSIYNTAQSFLNPNFKPTTPDMAAQTRVSNELAPYTTMLDLGIKERQGMPDFTKMAQMAFLKQASGAPLSLGDTAAINAWRNMGQNGITFDPSTGNMIQTNSRMPNGMASPVSNTSGMPSPGGGFGQGGNNPPTQPSPTNYNNTPPGLTPKAGAAFLNKRAEDLAGAADASATAQATVQSLDKAIDQALSVNDKIPGGASQDIGNLLGQNIPAFSDINQNTVLYKQAIGNNILAGLQTLKGLGRLDIPEVNQIIQTYGIGVENSPPARAAGLEALRQYIHNNVGTAQNIYSNMTSTPNTQQTPIQSIAPQQIFSDQDYNALPSGAAYIDPQGNQRRKN